MDARIVELNKNQSYKIANEKFNKYMALSSSRDTTSFLLSCIAWHRPLSNGCYWLAYGLQDFIPFSLYYVIQHKVVYIISGK